MRENDEFQRGLSELLLNNRIARLHAPRLNAQRRLNADQYILPIMNLARIATKMGRSLLERHSDIARHFFGKGEEDESR